MYSSSLRIDASMLFSILASPFPLYFLDKYSTSVSSLGIMQFISFLAPRSICLFFLCLLKEWFQVSYKGNNRIVYLFDESLVAKLSFEKFSRSSEIIVFHFFLFHLHSFVGVNFQYCQLLVSFLFSERSDSWFGSSIPSIMCCFFPILIISITHFSMPNFILRSWLYILIVCIWVFNSFFHFCEQFNVVYVH